MVHDPHHRDIRLSEHIRNPVNHFLFSHFVLRSRTVRFLLTI